MRRYLSNRTEAPSRHHRWSRCTLVVLVVLSSASFACKHKAPSAPPPPTVLVTKVVQEDVPVFGEWVGTTAGKINAQIRARVEGYLDSRHYLEGSTVHKGDLLFVIDPRTYQAELDDAKGELGEAEAALTKAEQDVARYTPLAKQGAVSQQELDDALQAVAAGRARVDSARAKVEEAQLNLDWTQVKSPIDGIVGIAVAQIGDLIAPSTLLTTVSDVDPIKVNFPISEQEYLVFAKRIGQIAAGDPRKQDAKHLELFLANGSKYPRDGEFGLADRQVDPSTGTITIVSYFPNPGNILRPGQFARVRGVLSMNEGALLVPQRAILDQQGQYRVGVVGADNKVELRTVEVGDRTESDWVVSKGLKVGERVIVEGLQKVHAGTVVEPKPYVAPTSPGTPPGKESDSHSSAKKGGNPGS